MWKWSCICFTLTSKVFVIPFHWGGTITKCTERRCHKHNNSLAAELNGAPLYGLLWVACKPPAVVLHEAASLSGIHVWTGHNCLYCCQRERMAWSSRLFSLSGFFFFFIEGSKDGKIQTCHPSFPLWPWQRARLWLSDFKHSLPDFGRGAKTSSFLPQSFLPKHFLWFDLAGRSAVALFRANQTQHKVGRQKVCISLTDALCTSSKCCVHWFELLFWSNAIYLCLWGVTRDGIISLQDKVR